LTLTGEERELLLAEVETALQEVRSPAVRERYEALREATAAGEVPPGLIPGVQALMGIGLQSGWIRRRHRADGEQVAQGLYERTPAGKSAREQADALTAALAGLRGQRLEQARVAPSGPGTWVLVLETDQGTVRVRFSDSGVGISGVEIG